MLPGAKGEVMSTQSPSLPNTLGSSTRETGPTTNFSSPSTSTPSFCESRLGEMRLLDSNVMVANPLSLNDASSSASVAKKASRTLELPRKEARTSGLTSWRKMMSGFLDSSRIYSRRLCARLIGRALKASIFHEMTEKRVVGDSLWGIWLCLAWLRAIFEGMGIHLRVEGLQ
jgi:hypothetical protein